MRMTTDDARRCNALMVAGTHAVTLNQKAGDLTIVRLWILHDRREAVSEWEVPDREVDGLGIHYPADARSFDIRDDKVIKASD